MEENFMKRFFRVISLILVCLLVIGLIGCGNKSSGTGETDKVSSASEVSLTNANTSVPNGNVTIDNLLGNWVDIKDATRFANITKTDTGYQFEDNDGKYPGQYMEGVLQIKITETDLADIYYDSSNENLVLDYQGDVTKFNKK
jgi:hypothetical protein